MARLKAASNCRAVSVVSIGRLVGLRASLFACVAQDGVVKTFFAWAPLAACTAIAGSRTTAVRSESRFSSHRAVCRQAKGRPASREQLVDLERIQMLE